MKSKLFIALLVAGFVFVGMPKAQAADTIAVTITLESSLSVSLDTTTWDLTNVALSSISADKTVKATVGNVATKIQIKSSTPAGGWTLGANAASDTCVISNKGTAITLTTSDQDLVASVPAYGVNTNDLVFHAPTADTKGGGTAQGVTITYTAATP